MACVDLEGWESTTGVTCHDYDTNDWCTHTGEYGSEWDFAVLGTFRDWASADGIDATQACCACKPLPPGTLTSAPTTAPTFAAAEQSSAPTTTEVAGVSAVLLPAEQTPSASATSPPAAATEEDVEGGDLCARCAEYARYGVHSLACHKCGLTAHTP